MESEAQAPAIERAPDEKRPAWVIGESRCMRDLFESVARIGSHDITVLIQGETGTGKEFVASQLHELSPRAAGPFVRFNCAAIPEQLAEAELFGHTRGAFTGADRSRPGFFSTAHRGTLVLDEIGELPLSVQAKLLRVLQGGEIQQIGGGRVEHVDVRVVACTNRNLAEEARSGRFRPDLYYRVAVVELVIPPLRDRPEDIPRLAVEFARRYGVRFGKPGVTLAPALLDAFRAQPWPGNVRQLENTVATLVALSEDRVVGPQHLGPGSSHAPPASQAAIRTLREQVGDLERRVIVQTLAECGGNKSLAARRLGMSRPTFIDRLRKYGLSLPRDAEQPAA